MSAILRKRLEEHKSIQQLTQVYQEQGTFSPWEEGWRQTLWLSLTCTLLSCLIGCPWWASSGPPSSTRRATFRYLQRLGVFLASGSPIAESRSTASPAPSSPPKVRPVVASAVGTTSPDKAENSSSIQSISKLWPSNYWRGSVPTAFDLTQKQK